jgi:hypothetical protein
MLSDWKTLTAALPVYYQPNPVMTNSKRITSPDVARGCDVAFRCL